MTFSLKHRKTQSANQLKLFTDQQLCDVTFVVNDGEISAHLFPFASLSNKCKNMAIIMGSNAQYKIQIDGNLDAFICVLKYAYSCDPQLGLNEDKIAAVKQICAKYNIPSLSEFCDEYLENTLPELKVQNTRKTIINKFKNNENAKTKWNDEVYGSKQIEYGKYKKSEIGRFAIHHILDSTGIRNEMKEIIPKNCNLKFSFDEVSRKQYRLIAKFNLSQKLTGKFGKSIDYLIDNRLYNSQIVCEINSQPHVFWCKSFGKSALDRAMGCEVSDYIMRFRKRIVIDFNEVLIELLGDNVGVGFCNLFPNKKTKNICGHSMIQIEEKLMNGVVIKCFVKENVYDVEVKMSFASQKLKNKIKSPCFFEAHTPKKPRNYNSSHGTATSVSNKRYSPMQFNGHINDNESVVGLNYAAPPDLVDPTFD